MGWGRGKCTSRYAEGGQNAFSGGPKRELPRLEERLLSYNKEEGGDFGGRGEKKNSDAG